MKLLIWKYGFKDLRKFILYISLEYEFVVGMNISFFLRIWVNIFRLSIKIGYIDLIYYLI